MFNQILREERIAENDLVFAIRDAHPVSPGHALVIPKRVVASWFDATTDEVAAMTELVAVVKHQLDESHGPAGYNVGFNDGEAAGMSCSRRKAVGIPVTRPGRRPLPTRTA
ncbi:HIT family protein [Curtobacterium sp. L1-20]|uniref:HIT family protein n=1 Tax=Curtobacterium sp. L1-20 TaxID=3138181 RepID=UPI003B51E65D